MVTSAIQNAQQQVESRNTEQRKNVLKYDDVMNSQREAIYTDRRHILEGENLDEKVQHFIEDSVEAVVSDATTGERGPEWDPTELWNNMRALYPVSITPEDMEAEFGNLAEVKAEDFRREFLSDAQLYYQSREESLGEDNMRELERRVVLQTIGQKWQEHLYEMDYLKDGIGLRAMAQRDPLVEYQREGFNLFQAMMQSIREESVNKLMTVEVETKPQATSLPGVTEGRGQTMTPDLRIKGMESPQEPSRLQFTGASDDGTGKAKTEVRAADSGTAGSGKAVQTKAERKAKERAQKKAKKQAKKNR